MLRAAIVLAAVLLAAVHVGCFSKPTEPLRDDASTQDDGGMRDAADRVDAQPDARPIDAPATQGCTLMTISSFDNGSNGCAPGLTGMASGSATIDYNGTQNFHLPPLNGLAASCTTNANYSIDDGVAVTFTSLPQQGAVSYFQLDVSISPVRVAVTSGAMPQVSLSCPGSAGTGTLLNAALPFTIRMKGTGATPDTIQVDVKSTAGTFTVGTCGLTNGGAMGSAEIGGMSAASAAGVASFDNLLSCPAPL